MKFLKFTAFILFVSVISSCSKDKDNLTMEESDLNAVTVKTIVNTTEVTGFADKILSNIYAFNASGKSAKGAECYTTVTSGQTSTITFTDCTVDGSEAVNGTLIAEYIIEGDALGLEVTYVDLSVGATQISGTRTMLFGVTDQMGQITININSDVQLTLEDGTLVYESGTRQVWFNDATDTMGQKISLAGAWNVTKNNTVYNVVITENLETELPCEYVSKGIMTITEGDDTASLNFGDGSCDDVALFTYPNGTTEEITLRD